jgi:hypothetical protein
MGLGVWLCRTLSAPVATSLFAALGAIIVSAPFDLAGARAEAAGCDSWSRVVAAASNCLISADPPGSQRTSPIEERVRGAGLLAIRSR